MSVLKIVQYPDPVLARKALPVTELNDALQVLIDDMFETMYAASGIGLAAPQIGQSMQLFVYDLQESNDVPRHIGVLINPVFQEKKGSQEGEEGCLSVEEYRTRVRRDAEVVIKGLNRELKEVTIKGGGLLARMFQHEMDHLEGYLFIDRISSLKRNIYLKRRKKLQKAEELH